MAVLEASAALIVVLTVIWVGARVISMTRLGRKHLAIGRSLAVNEVLSLDSQRRLLLISCDTKRVLLMTGGPTGLSCGLA